MKPTSDALLACLLELHPKVIDLSLERMERILEALGNPERNLPTTIHIAGTNGKGSTQAMLKAGFEAMGKKVHAYTSPHLAQFHERIYLAGAHISEDYLAEILAEVEKVNAGEPITFFEVTTAAAFLAFSRIPADILLLEVGLGGRLDATNVMTPALSIITPVSIDHEAYLGNTLDLIAREKGGIIKKNVPVILGIQPDEARDALEDIARKLGAPVTVQNQDFQSYVQHGRLAFEDETGLWDLPLPALKGPHQIDNAGPVLKALKDFGADEKIAARALLEVTWPARMQRLAKGPLVDAANGAELWLDGGHNPAAGDMLALTLRDLPSKPLIMICGMLNTKDVRGYLRPLAPMVSSFIAVSIEGEAATLLAEDTAQAASDVGMNATTADSVLKAIQSIDDIEGKRILICGSLYLAGRVLRENA